MFLVTFLSSFLFVGLCLPVDNIPPTNLYFKIRNKVSRRIMYSMKDGQFGASVEGGHNDDQLWRVDSVTEDGYFRLLSYETGKVIYNNERAVTKFGVESSNPSYPDHFWNMDSPTNDGDFRLLNKKTLNVIFAGRGGSQTTDFGVESSVDLPVPVSDQFWNFEYEDFEFVSIEFDLDEGFIEDQKPEAISSDFCDNSNGGGNLKCEFSVDETISKLVHFSHRSGVELLDGSKFNTGIPFVRNGEISRELTIPPQEFEWGKDKVVSQRHVSKFEITAKKGQIIKAEALVSSGILEVPYKIKMRVKNTNREFYSTGIWYGVSTWGLRVSTTLIN